MGNRLKLLRAMCDYFNFLIFVVRKGCNFFSTCRCNKGICFYHFDKDFKLLYTLCKGKGCDHSSGQRPSVKNFTNQVTCKDKILILFHSIQKSHFHSKVWRMQHMKCSIIVHPGRRSANTTLRIYLMVHCTRTTLILKDISMGHQLLLEERKSTYP